MTPIEFRKELLKIMPGYKWTVHKNKYIEPELYLCATGIQFSGFNRISTLQVERRIRKSDIYEDMVFYEVKSAGFGAKSLWLSSAENVTLARALRDLQNHYQNMASKYSAHESALQFGRNKSLESEI